MFARSPRRDDGLVVAGERRERESAVQEFASTLRRRLGVSLVAPQDDTISPEIIEAFRRPVSSESLEMAMPSSKGLSEAKTLT